MAEELDPRLGKLLAEYLQSEQSPNGSRATLREVKELIKATFTAAANTNERVLEVAGRLDAHVASFAEWKAHVDAKLEKHDEWSETTGNIAVQQLQESVDARKERRQMFWKAVAGIGLVLSNLATAGISYYLTSK